MKTLFLVLMIALDETSYLFHRLPFSYSSDQEPITCDEFFESKVIFKDGNTFYKRFIVMAHHCEDQYGNYYIGYEEKLNWQLNDTD